MQVVKYNVSVSLSSKDIDLVVDEAARMAISALGYSTSLNALVPPQLFIPFLNRIQRLFLHTGLTTISWCMLHCVYSIAIQVKKIIEIVLYAIGRGEDTIHGLDTSIISKI